MCHGVVLLDIMWGSYLYCYSNPLDVMGLWVGVDGGAILVTAKVPFPPKKLSITFSNKSKWLAAPI